VQEHEPVQLGFGEFERPGLLDRILGGDDEERRRELQTLATQGDLALLHGFKHGALHLRSRAVDLVREQQVREDRPAVNTEFAGLLIDDFGPEDVRRQHIDGELDPLEVEVDGLGNGVDQERLREARHALQQQVAAGEERDHHAFDDDVLADDDQADAFTHGADELLGGLGGGHGTKGVRGWD